MASLTGAMNGSPPELGPIARVISEAEAFRQMSPIDRLRLNMPSNWAPVGEEQASQNQQQNLRDLLSIVPGPGNVIAAEDATQSFGDAANYAQQGRYGRAALMGGLGLLSGFGAVTGLPTGRMAGAAARGARDVAPAFPAWHGSPHDFDEFKLDKIGTGEGAQTYGHGLYFAENPEVAGVYRDTLGDVTVNGKAVDSKSSMFAINKLKGTLDDREKALRTQLADHMASPADAPGRDLMISKTREMLGQIENIRNADVKTTGRLYKAELDVEPHQLLDWDKPLSQQSPEVRTAFAKIAESHPNEFRKPEIRRWLKDDGGFMTGAQAYDTLAGDFGGREAFTQRLREAGIPGIRYLDQGSRGASGGTSNYVIFDDKLAKILSKE